MNLKEQYKTIMSFYDELDSIIPEAKTYEVGDRTLFHLEQYLKEKMDSLKYLYPNCETQIIELYDRIVQFRDNICQNLFDDYETAGDDIKKLKSNPEFLFAIEYSSYHLKRAMVDEDLTPVFNYIKLQKFLLNNS